MVEEMVEEMSKRTRRRRGFGFLLTGLAVLIWLGLGTAVADAQTEPELGTITDYENYPLAQGVVPEGCTAQGADLLVGEQYSVNGGAGGTNLRTLNLAIGDTLTMTWDSLAAGCEGAIVTLSMKATSFTQFEISDNQYSVLSTSCNGSGPTCESLDNSLSLALAPSAPVPCFQVDAHIGAPLNVVGPNGSYYGSLNGTYNVLIGAKNAGTEPCDFEPCVTNPEIPAASKQCISGTQTQITPCPLDASLPADSPDCSPCESNPAVAAGSPECVPCATNPALPADSPDCASPPTTAPPATQPTATTIAGPVAPPPAPKPAVAAQTLPATGADSTLPLTLLGVALLATGATLVRRGV